MKEKYENLLERQNIVEEKIDELEQDLETSMDALEFILDRLGHMNEAVTKLVENELPPGISISQIPPGWEPMARQPPKLKPARKTKTKTTKGVNCGKEKKSVQKSKIC
jgi:hypothetical protein|tara:strand:+ start:818 stop:1141 length:324 start_codon:yes stop_codon:yes gene_type:complete